MVSLKPGSVIGDTMKNLGLAPDMWIAVKNNVIVPIDDQIYDGDDINLIRVASGG